MTAVLPDWAFPLALLVAAALLVRAHFHALP
jgi:hypothetical protein